MRKKRSELVWRVGHSINNGNKMQCLLSVLCMHRVQLPYLKSILRKSIHFSFEGLAAQENKRRYGSQFLVLIKHRETQNASRCTNRQLRIGSRSREVEKKPHTLRYIVSTEIMIQHAVDYKCFLFLLPKSWFLVKYSVWHFLWELMGSPLWVPVKFTWNVLEDYLMILPAYFRMR